MSGGEHHFLMFYYSIIFAGNVNLSLGEVAFLSFPIFPPDIMLDLEPRGHQLLFSALIHPQFLAGDLGQTMCLISICCMKKWIKISKDSHK